MREFKQIARDLAGLAGISLVSFGVWRIYQPAGFIVAGAILTAIALLSD